MNMRSWHVVQDVCKMKSKNEIVRVEDEIVTQPLVVVHTLCRREERRK